MLEACNSALSLRDVYLKGYESQYSCSPMRKMRGPPAKLKGVVIFDMDDTLVNREDVFLQAQRGLLTMLKRRLRNVRPRRDIDRLREVDYELVRLHGHRYMYDPLLLVYALWYSYHEGKSPRQAAKSALLARPACLSYQFAHVAATRYISVLGDTVPEVIDDAYLVLCKLKQSYVLVLLASGEKGIQTSVIRGLGFDAIFDVLMVVERKNPSSFRKAARLGLKVLGTTRQVGRVGVFSVGDRISTDILPAKAIGATTIWMPGRYRPGTAAEAQPDHIIGRLRDLLQILT